MSEICKICMEGKEGLVEIQKCGHRFCEQCIRMYLEYNVSVRNIYRLICMKAGCDAVLGLEEIERFADQDVISKYKKFCRED